MSFAKIKLFFICIQSFFIPRNLSVTCFQLPWCNDMGWRQHSQSIVARWNACGCLMVWTPFWRFFWLWFAYWQIFGLISQSRLKKKKGKEKKERKKERKKKTKLRFWFHCHAEGRVVYTVDSLFNEYANYRTPPFYRKLHFPRQNASQTLQIADRELADLLISGTSLSFPEKDK